MLHKTSIYSAILFMFVFSMIFLTTVANAQDDETPQSQRFFVLELMSVDDMDNSDYMEVEAFWKKIHEARVANGDILGWDLWSLSSNGSANGYQYLTITQFSNPVMMMTGGDLWSAVQAAHSDMAEEDLNSMWELTAASRDIAEKYYLRELDIVAADDTIIEPGLIMFLDFMNANPSSVNDYVRAELDLFRPMHEEQILAGGKMAWNISSVMVPYGSSVGVTHMTANIFRNWDHVFSGIGAPQPDADTQAAMQEAIMMRDLSITYVGTLVSTVR